MANAPATKTAIYTALMQRCGFQVLNEHETDSQLRFTGRCAHDRWAFFLPVIYQITTVSERPGSTWTSDISKKYIVHNKKVLYTWRIIFQAADLKAARYGEIAAVILSSEQPARVELDRMLLPGYKEGDVRGGFNARGKGTGSAGSTPPTIAARLGGR